MDEKTEKASFDRVISQPLIFKSALGIGEDAYIQLVIERNAAKVWGAVTGGATGAAIAGSSAVAGTFFANSSLLGMLGLGAATTPVGWVVAGGALCALAGWGVVSRVSGKKASVSQVPRFINTPLDVLGLGLYEVMVPLAVYVIRSDGDVHENELLTLKEYLIEEWGYDQTFVDQTVLQLLQTDNDIQVEDLIHLFHELISNNPDCDVDTIWVTVSKLLNDLVAADGIIEDEELAAIETLHSLFNRKSSSGYEQNLDKAKQQVEKAYTGIRTKSSDLLGIISKKASGIYTGGKEFSGRLIDPTSNPDISIMLDSSRVTPPTLWLLGKTGAGKSSLVQAITGEDQVVIGSGFKPCTKNSFVYDYPTAQPLLRFLDTRGLGEVNYDPKEDLASCNEASHALIVVCRLDDPQQTVIFESLREIKKKEKNIPVLAVFTGIDLIKKLEEIELAIGHFRGQFKQYLNEAVPWVAVSLRSEMQGKFTQILADAFIDFMPQVALLMEKKETSDQEVIAFEQVKKEILHFSTLAGSSDLLPAVGLISVPTMHALMLRSLAAHYQISWGRRELSEFLGVLGLSFGLTYSAKLTLRQAIHLIPIYGQTVGAVVSGALSMATTYALGRVAAKYMYSKRLGLKVNQEELKHIYENAFNGMKAGKSVA